MFCCVAWPKSYVMVGTGMLGRTVFESDSWDLLGFLNFHLLWLVSVEKKKNITITILVKEQDLKGHTEEQARLCLTINVLVRKSSLDSWTNHKTIIQLAQHIYYIGSKCVSMLIFKTQKN